MSRVSASNCATIYKATWSSSQLPDDWKFRDSLSHEHVFEGFKLLSLLKHHNRQKTALVVPHTAEKRKWYDKAMEERNFLIRDVGQPELHHCCMKCVRQE